MACSNKQFIILGFVFSLLITINPISAMPPLPQAKTLVPIKLEYYFEVSTKHLDRVFEDAPPEVKMIVRHLQDPSFLKKSDYRAVFLVGEPGTGKSTLAKAIAYQMYKSQGWKCTFNASTCFINTFRGGTAINLTHYLNDIMDLFIAKFKTVVIIDEINHLLDHAGSAYHDTDATSNALCAFLDEHKGNRDIFIIGTLNDCTKIPQSVKSRIAGNCVELKPAESFAAKKKVFLSQLLDESTRLHAECDDTFLKEFLMPLHDWTHRDLSTLAIEALKMFKLEDDKSPKVTIKKRHLEGGYRKCMAARKLLNFGEKVETSTERQEKHFIRGRLLEHPINLKLSPYESKDYRLFQQCLAVLKVPPLPEGESGHIRFLLNQVPVTAWATVDWKHMGDKIFIGNDPKKIIPTLEKLLKESVDKMAYVYWLNDDQPVVKADLDMIIRFFDVVTNVSFQKVIFNPEQGYVVEVQPNGDITVGLVADYKPSE